MKKRILRDFNKRITFKLFEVDNVVIKALGNNLIATYHYPTMCEISKIRNICKDSGRTRGIIKNLGLSRLKFRQLADEGKLAGYRRAS